MKNDIDWNLLGRYLFGECSKEEAAKIEAWLEEDPTREARLEELRQVQRLTRNPSSSKSWDTGTLWNRVAERTRPQEAASDAPEPVGDVPERTLDRSARRRRARRSSTRSPARRASAQRAVAMGALALVFIAVFTLWLHGPWTTPTPEATRTFATQAGQRATVRLADGTRVQLNVDSRLTVSATFGEERRAVQLEGEAFFEVAKDSTRPFRVHTPEGAIQVVGTAFNVNAYAEDAAVQVAVAEGAVALHVKNVAEATRADTVVLRPSQLGVMADEQLRDLRRDVDITSQIAWRDGQLVFEDAPFSEVVRRLERWYDLQIEIPPDHESIDLLNAVFDQESVREVFGDITIALDLQYEQEGQRIVFYRRAPSVPDEENALHAP